MNTAWSGGSSPAFELEAPSAYAHIRWDGTDAPPKPRQQPRTVPVMGYRVSGTGGGGAAPVGSGGRFDCPGCAILIGSEHEDTVGPDISLAVLSHVN